MSDEKAGGPEAKPSDKVSNLRHRDATLVSAQRLMQNEIQAILFYVMTVASALKREREKFDAKIARWAASLPERNSAAFYEAKSNLATSPSVLYNSVVCNLLT